MIEEQVSSREDTVKTAYWLSEESPLAKKIKGFSLRESQLQLAEAIEDTIASHEILIAEAGTGTGKTFAYLIPAFLSGKKTLISTGTKTLQDQLYFRDIPYLRKAMALPAKVSLLKGRSNYLCLHRLNHAEDFLFSQGTIEKHLNRIREHLPLLKDGDVNEIKNVPEDSPAWYYATSTADNCLGSDCEYFEDCYLVKARRRAMTADMVVINHHLLFSDWKLKEEEEGELLPQAEVLVIDEAHQLPEVASQFLGMRFSGGQLTALVKESLKEHEKEAKEFLNFEKVCDIFEESLETFRKSLGPPQTRGAWSDVRSVPTVIQTLDLLKKDFLVFVEQLQEMAAKSEELERCWQQAHSLKMQLESMTAVASTDMIHWYETFQHSFAIYQTPLSIAAPFRHWVDKMSCAWIFTSATLTVKDSFEGFKEQLGLHEARELLVSSPFNYEQHALLYVPRYLPHPQGEAHTIKVVEAAIPLIKKNQGRTFFLVTSHRALREAADLLTKEIEYPLFIQGEKPKEELLKNFVEHGHGVLLGTYSFWEGVDVPGLTLSCVVIDKLPFPSPMDPVNMARGRVLKTQGKNAFYEMDLPKAVLSLKQGVGRLIRSIDDMGVVMVGDPRLVGKEYGSIFLASLPNMQRTRDENTVISFIAHIHEREE